MNLIGRYEKIRAIGPGGYGPPLMLDRGSKSTNAQVRPYKGEYWDRTRAGLYVPRVAGGIGFSGTSQIVGRVLIPGVTGGTTALAQTTIALDSNYVAGTSGDAVGARFVLPATKTFDSIYFFITSITGTAGNVNDLDLEIRTDAAGGIPDATAPGLIDSETVDPASTTGWIAKQFATPQSITGGTTYHVLVGDADGNGTDFATVLKRATSMFTAGFAFPGSIDYTNSTTTTGWTSGNTLDGFAASVCVKFSDNSLLGNPFTSSSNSTSDQFRRGILMSGLTEQLKVFGYGTSSLLGGSTGVDVFSGTDLSSATPFATADVTIFTIASIANKQGYLFSSPITLAKSTQYRHVFKYSVNTNVPIKYNIGTGADAYLRSAMFGGGSWYWTTDSAGPTWVDDSSAWPNMCLLVEDQVAVSAGGGSGGTDDWIIGGPNG